MFIHSGWHVPQVDAQDFNTLDEPIKKTILRDIYVVGSKFLNLLYPKEDSSLLKNWDLWGPLVLCTFMATILDGSTNNLHNGGIEFSEVFVIVWLGAGVVTLNSKLLGGTISFFQSVCVLGYCLAPVAVSLGICRILINFQTSAVFFLRLITTTFGFLWSCYASYIFFGESQTLNRKALAYYPIFLFFFVVSWLVISRN